MKQPGKTSKGELRAILALVLIGVVVIAVRSGRNPAATPAPFIPEVTHVAVQESPKSEYSRKTYPKRSVQHKNQYNHNTPEQRPAKQSPQVQCSPFNPNTVTEEELTGMGIKVTVIKNMLRYRNAGATFRAPEDLRKIYGMDSTLFSSIVSCIDIPTQEHVQEKQEQSKHKTLRPLDINTADEETWKALPGIGDVLAARIVKFRESLGGFASIDQVGEIYGLPPETYGQIREKLHMETAPRRLNLNLATAEELSAHPYISYRQAHAIVNYRANHGAFKETEDVLQVLSLNADWLNQLAPYLTCRESSDLATR